MVLQWLVFLLFWLIKNVFVNTVSFTTESSIFYSFLISRGPLNYRHTQVLWPSGSSQSAFRLCLQYLLRFDGMQWSNIYRSGCCCWSRLITRDWRLTNRWIQYIFLYTKLGVLIMVLCEIGRCPKTFIQGFLYLLHTCWFINNVEGHTTEE